MTEAFKCPTDLTIVGMGGCGKKLAREICDYDWLLHEYSRGMNRLRIFTMDTDASERIQDKKLETEIMEKVNKLNGTGNILFQSYFLPGLASVEHVADLTSSKVSTSIKDSQSVTASTWWLHDPENGITFKDLKNIDPYLKDDFGGGVHRRRAISKAVLYKVLNEGQSNGFPSFSSPGDVAIIVGLGGGSGSGMFIDLARYIKKGRDNKIYLFAVLPTTKEGVKEQLNAAISITELEYLNVLQEEGLLDHVIFTSLGPTEYANGQQELKEVRDFDSVFPQILLNFFYIEKGDLQVSDTRKFYSSFIFADSHIIEYPVEELRKLKKQYSQIVDELGEIVTARKAVNDEIEKLLSNFNISGESIPTEEVFEVMKKEYKNIEMVWTNNIAELLNYHSVVKIKDFIQYNVSDVQFDQIKTYNDLTSYISRVKYCTQGVEQYKIKDEIDKKLSALIPSALETLENTASLFKRISFIETEECRSVMIDILKGKLEISSLVGSMKARSQEIQDLDTKLKATEQNIGELDSLSRTVEDNIEQILNDIDSDLASYVQVITNIKALPTFEKELKTKLEDYINKLKSGKVKEKKKNNWYLSAGRKQLREEIDNYSSELNLDLNRLNKFMDAVTDYYYYNYMLEEIEKFSVKMFVMGNKQALKSKYTQGKGKAEEHISSNKKDWGIDIAPPFEIIIPDNFLTLGLMKKSIELIEQIYNPIYRDLNDDSLRMEKLKEICESGDRVIIRKSLREYLRGLYLNAAGYFKKKQELSKSKEELEGELKEKNLLLNMLENVDAAKNETFSIRRDCGQHYDKFHTLFENINQKRDIETTSGIYKSKLGSVNPKILSLVEDGSNMGNLDKDTDGVSELNRLINLAKSKYYNLFENRNLGVNSITIQIAETEKWNFDKAAVVVSSTSGYVRSELMKSTIEEDIIFKNMSLRSRNDSRCTAHEYTKPWEIVLTFFAASSFLDNIYPLVAGGGYWEIYAKNKENILHHVLKLQDGKYITRNALLSSKNAGRIAQNIDSKGLKEIKDLYEIKSLKEALGRENQQ